MRLGARAGAGRGPRLVIALAAFVVVAVAAPAARARIEGSSPPSTLLPPVGAPPSTAPPSSPGSSMPTSTTTTTTAPGGATTVPTGDGTTTDGLSPLGGGPGQIVPPDAAAFIASLPRSAPNDDKALVDGEQALIAAGYDREQAARVAYGHFPVAGPAHWSDDWLEPRFDGTEFRYHYGIDVIAPYGTPLRAPDDGVVSVEQSDVGGLTVKVLLPGGTFYELAHLSATAPGIAPGVTVHTGDIVGYVGATGDATGPHLHFGWWIGGVTPTSPKPLLDQWVTDAAANVRALLDPSHPEVRSLLGTTLTRALTDGAAGGPASPTAATADLLLASAANPAGGALQLARETASEAAHAVDWARRSDEETAARQAWAAATERAWLYLGPLTPRALRPVLAPASSLWLSRGSW